MENKDLLKELEALKKRITDLESKQKDNLGMFGRSYNQTGNSNSDFLIKTRGQVKIQWGNKFIDLIKDGKLNVDTKIVYSVGSKEEISNKEGIYVTSDNDVYLKVGSNDPINLVGEAGTTYVSFQEEQITKSEEKYKAFKNIGFIYSSINEIDENSLKNGIIYIENEQQLYTVRNGQLQKFTVEFPNPFINQFIITKNDDKIGSLVIQGQGLNNSLAFDSLYIFTKEGNAYLQAKQKVIINLNEKNYLEVTKSKTSIKNILEVDNVRSIGATSEQGFVLSKTGDETTLTIDNLIVRNSDQSSFYNPIEWSYGRNVILSIKPLETSEETSEETSQPQSISKYQITLQYENKYKIGDQLYFYADVKKSSEQTESSEEQEVLNPVKIPVEITAYSEIPNTILVEVIEDLLFEKSIIESGKVPKCSGRIISLLKTDTEIITVRSSDNAIDIITCNNIQDESNIASIVSRRGDLTELKLKEGTKDNREIAITGSGDYTKQGYFSKAGYISSYNLPDEDDSTKMASTEWVRKLLNNQIPIGTIIAFHGSTLPTGWAVCDGNNGTPNLVGKFIKGGSSESEGDEIKISPSYESNGTGPYTIKIAPKYYSLVFIMKIK